VFYLRGVLWIVIDRIETDRPRKLQALWHWHPDCSVQVRGLRVRSTDAGKGNLEIIPVGTVPWKVAVVKGQQSPRLQGWYSEKYNRVVPSPTAVYSAAIQTNATFLWALVPAKGEVPDVDVSVESQTDDHVIVRVVSPGKGEFRIAIPTASGGKPNLLQSPVSLKARKLGTEQSGSSEPN